MSIANQNNDAVQPKSPSLLDENYKFQVAQRAKSSLVAIQQAEQEIRQLVEDTAASSGSHGDDSSLATEIVITGALSFGFYKHVQESIKSAAERTFKHSTIHKAETHINNASIWATNRLVPPVAVDIYRKVPQQLKSIATASLLGIAFFEHASHLHHKYNDVFSRVSKSVNDKKQKILNVFR